MCATPPAATLASHLLPRPLQENSGAAIGINETVGYTTIAIVTEIAAAILDEDYPRRANFYVVAGIIAVGIAVSLVFLKESKPVRCACMCRALLLLLHV
jgi:sugar phosphate permease